MKNPSDNTPSPSPSLNDGDQLTIPPTRPSTPTLISSDDRLATYYQSPPSERNRWPSPPAQGVLLEPLSSPEIMSNSDSIITRIGLAGHDLLLMAENETYIKLFNSSEELKETVGLLKAENAALRFAFERLVQTCSHRCDATSVILSSSES
ncbi:hypothetical protein BDN72DRAFT_894332 [Pluteus cervinus]|uniref:Uncharacterized protein n=1 Tax=Pluteus cervinus TaxID=181527 RepID=A0ACD3B3J4_9AGAR|nr:hypothetical protein BDN72DRAFT_894332 [Pluteus cervinus]